MLRSSETCVLPFQRCCCLGIGSPPPCYPAFLVRLYLCDQSASAPVSSQVLQDVRQKYANSEQSQLETVADWLLAAFQESELQFLNILHDQPMSKACPSLCQLDWSSIGTAALAEFLDIRPYICSLGYNRQIRHKAQRYM